jgi:hypothetical protein
MSPNADGRQSYRSFSFDPSQPAMNAPMAIRPRSQESNFFSADRKVKGIH